MTSCIVLLAHGSRDPAWRAPIEAIATAIRGRDPEQKVVCAYLELCGPDLATATAQTLDKNTERVRIVPIFFGMGRHAREDLPRLVGELEALYPGVVFELLPAAGEQPRLTALLAELALSPDATKANP